MSVSVTFGEGCHCMEVISMPFCRFPFDVGKIIECFLRQPIYDNTQKWFVIQFLGSRAGKASTMAMIKKFRTRRETLGPDEGSEWKEWWNILSYKATLFVIKSAEE